MSIKLVVFTRAPIPGQCKTRLIPVVGTEQAAQLSHAFLCDTLERSRVLDAQHFLYVAGDLDHASIVETATNFGAELRTQAQGDLGDKLVRASADMHLEKGDRLLIVGSDAPSIPEEYFLQAVAALNHSELVLGPSVDGGYYLIATSCTFPESFFRGVRWSTQYTLQDTQACASRYGWRVTSLPPWYDIDDAEGLMLHRLYTNLAPKACTYSARLLEICH